LKTFQFFLSCYQQGRHREEHAALPLSILSQLLPGRSWRRYLKPSTLFQFFLSCYHFSWSSLTLTVIVFQFFLSCYEEVGGGDEEWLGVSLSILSQLLLVANSGSGKSQFFTFNSFSVAT
jgi:hypothetical protein